MAERSSQRATARLVQFPRVQVVLAVVQLPLLVAAVVVAIMQRWETLGMIAAAYAVATLARFALTRVRRTLIVHETGIMVGERSLKWDELGSARSWFLATRAGDKLSIVTDKEGEAAVDLMKARWVEHVLAKTRAELAAGQTVQLGELRVHPDGIERGGNVVPWDRIELGENDGFVMVFGRVAVFDSDVPDGAVTRALLRDHGR